MASAGYSGEAAFFVGDANHANARSFAGIFHTGQAAVGTGGGAYVGKPNPETGEFWVGGTIGLPIPYTGGLGGGFVDWDYMLIGEPRKLPECLCKKMKSNIP